MVHSVQDAWASGTCLTNGILLWGRELEVGGLREELVRDRNEDACSVACIGWMLLLLLSVLYFPHSIYLNVLSTIDVL